MDSGFSKHHALLGTGFTFAKATPGDRWTGAEQAPQSSGKAQCSLATPSGHLGSSLLCPKGNTCENSQGWAARRTLEENPHYLRSNVAHAILEEGESRPEKGLCTSIALNAIVSLGSPNTSLPYLVTMETGAAC